MTTVKEAPAKPNKFIEGLRWLRRYKVTILAPLLSGYFIYMDWSHTQKYKQQKALEQQQTEQQKQRKT